MPVALAVYRLSLMEVQMLVLSRRMGQRVRVGEEIVVTLLSVRGGRARIGIEAPIGISVDRQELREQKTGSRPQPPEPNSERR
jgi:carbon storage regulator